MLNQRDEIFIKKYVNEAYFDVEKLLKYLNMHNIVGNEVFSYVDKKACIKRNRREGYSQWLDDEEGYVPLDLNSFIRRVPFYFFVWDGDIKKGGGDLGDILYASYEDRKIGIKSLEDVYQALEYLFYDRKIALYDIFNYMSDQTGQVTQKYFWDWVEYLHIINDLNGYELMPQRFITAFNYALEEIGESPRIYRIYEIDPNGALYHRHGNKMTFYGDFPCDDAGVPILRWLGLKFENVAVMSCSCEKSETGWLTIEISPESKIDVYDEDSQGELYWWTMYIGPRRMDFNHKLLKEQREYWGMTQKEVADAVGTSERTYQKWEYGETKPDCYYLLRLLNWLQIDDIQMIVKMEQY